MNTVQWETVDTTHDIMENVTMHGIIEGGKIQDGVMDADMGIGGVSIPGMTHKKLMTTEEVARYFNIKPRTVQLWVAKGWLMPQKMSRPDGVPGGFLNGFDIKDVDKLMQKRATTKMEMEIMPAMTSPVTQTVGPPMHRGVTAQDIAQLIGVPLPKEPQEKIDQQPEIPWREKNWLSIEEAMALSGLGRGYIEDHGKGERIGPKGSMVYKRVVIEKL